MKYTLQIAFSKPVGDILLRVCEYAKKYGSSSADYINPLLFDFSDDSVIEVKRPEKNCPVADTSLFALEIFNGIPLRWMTKNSCQSLKDENDIEEFFEREYSDKIVEEKDIDPEMHIVFYVPLYETGIYKHINYIIDNLPVGHKFVVNVIGITYDVAWSCKMLPTDTDKESCNASMLRNIQEITRRTYFENDSLIPTLRNVFIFQNYNISGWSQKFTTKKLIDICANLSLAMVQYYDVICHYSWNDFVWEVDENGKRKKESKEPRRIYAINIQSRVIDLYLAVNHIFRNLFSGVADDHVIDDNSIDKEKVKDAYKKILEEEVKLISDYKDSLASGLASQSEYDDLFSKEVKAKLKNIIESNISSFNLNVSEQQYLYSLFSDIKVDTNFESKEFDDAIWQLEEMMLEQLDGDANLLDAYHRLKRCSKELTETNERISELENTIRDLQSKIDNDYPANGEITEEGFKIGNEVFKPYKCQDVPLDANYEAPKDLILPPSVDLRNDFSTIRNQGNQGACSAFSLVSVIEYFLSKILKKKTDLSEAFVYYNARDINHATDEDEGTNFHDIIQSIRDNGVCVEELCPYNPDVYNEKPSEEAYTEATGRKITEAKNVGINVNDVKSALAQGFPVVISARAFDTYLTNANGVLRTPTDKELEDETKNHAMVICGYTDREGFFIVRNSWGTAFGDNGYCYLPYEYFRTPNAINQAYVVTGLNIEGFEAGQLPAVDSILDGKDVNAQYSIYKNMLLEASHKLDSNRNRLDNLRQEYIRLFNKIGDYSNVELTLKDLKEKTDQQRAELEERLKQIVIDAEQAKPQQQKKNFFNFFKKDNADHSYDDEKKRIESELESLDHYADDEKRKYRIRLAILNGLKNINKDCVGESIRRRNLSDYYKDQTLRIEKQDKEDAKAIEEIKQIIPLDDIVAKLKTSGITNLISDLSDTISKIIHGDIGLYEMSSDLNAKIINRISEEMNLRISDHLNNRIYDSFYTQINRSSVMAQIHGDVPTGFGDETKYFFCNVEDMPLRVAKECDGIRLLPISDNLRMCFLHMEKYNVDDFIVFREAKEKAKARENLLCSKGESAKKDKYIETCVRLAAHVYGSYSNNILPTNCKILDEIDDKKTGLKAKFYALDSKNAICAFAGTRNLKDWANNITQAFGMSSQYDKALEYGKMLQTKFPNYTISFVGHSQGGGEAAYCALHLGAKAITFNPAGLSHFTTWKGKSQFTRYVEIHAYIFWNDVLNKLQDATEQFEEFTMLPTSLKADGVVHYINDYEPLDLTPGEWHGMKGILRYFGIKE